MKLNIHRLIVMTLALLCLSRNDRFCHAVSDDQGYTDMVGLTNDQGQEVAKVFYRLDVLDDSIMPKDSMADSDGVNAISMKMTYKGNAWVGIGLTTAGMVGGEVMIGRPNDGVSLFGPITSISAYGVQESLIQNSIESSIEQSNGETIMTFTRVINDGIFLAFNSKGLNSFIWAVGGEGVEFPSYHSGGRGLITIDLSKAERPGGVKITD